MSNLKQLIDGINAAKKQFEADAGAALKTACKDFFDSKPEVTAIAWTQYAPYFNDGEPCEFSVNEIYATTMPLEGSVEVDGEEFEFSAHELACGEYSYSELEKFNADDAETTEFLRLLSQVPDDLYRSMFGDDALVLITRDGITTDEYDHE